MPRSEAIAAGLKRVARREGVTVDELVERWLQEKLSDDMLRRLLEAAGANKPNPSVLLDKKCAVTMYDMHVRLMSDGGRRGLWVFLKDESPERKVNEGALLEWPAARALHSAMGKALKGRR